MKIIKDPDIWWDGKILSCPHCGCMFQVDSDDKPKKLEPSQFGPVVGWDCPLCDTTVHNPEGV